MSNITNAKNKLRQKLSLNDITSINQHTSKKVHRQTSTPVRQKKDARKNTILQAARQTSMPANQQAAGEKIKATYYLSESDNQALMNIFIKRLQEKQKTDKSALISEAIQLLYKREIKK